jgi:signal transduction histidine kinase
MLASSPTALARYGRLALWPLGAAFGLLTLAIARHNPAASLGGGSTLGGVAELAGGWGLIASGLLFWGARPRNRSGPLLVAAGMVWFLPEWANPGIGSQVAFVLGLIGLGAAGPFVAHAVLAYPTGTLPSALERAVLLFGYAGAVLVLGVLPTLVFDPSQQGCSQCPGNPLLLHGDLGLYGDFNRWGVRVGLGWAIMLAGLAALRLLRSSRTALPVIAAVVLPAAAYLALVAWNFAYSLRSGLLTNDSFSQRLWRFEAGTLVLVGFGVVWGLLRARRARSSVAQLVVELERSPELEGLQGALARALGDPTLELLYNRGTSGGYVDAAGRPVELDPGPGRHATPLLRGEAQIAAVVHDARLLDEPGLLQEVIAAARLGVEKEQLQAEVRAQLEELRASRARIVEAGDAERRRLERNLHDGAQQRLVGLALALGLIRSRVRDGDAAVSATIERAEQELRQALADLREFAHGVHPAVLSDEGLAAAVESLVERSEFPISVTSMPKERLRSSVETAAYFVIAQALERSDGVAFVGVAREDGRLVINIKRASVADNADFEARLSEIADRVGALNGTVHVRRPGGELLISAEIPCK